MKHLVFSALLFILLVALGGCQSSEPAVVTVDLQQILTKSQAAQAANEHLAKVQGILQQGMDAYQAEILKVSDPSPDASDKTAAKGAKQARTQTPDEQQQADLQKGLIVLRQQLMREQAAARAVVERHMLAQINAWQVGKKSVVVTRQNLLSAPAVLDITADIIARMDAAGAVQFAELPKVSIHGKEASAQPGTDANAAKSGK